MNWKTFARMGLSSPEEVEMGSAIERLIALSAEDGDDLTSLDSLDFELVEVFASEDRDSVALSKGLLERAPGKNDNWIESVGSLPAYIEEVANSLHTKRGMTISRAIATAISRIKKWAVTGKADTKAKAAKAIAQWEALRAKAAAKRAKKG